jgi:peptidoglycan biosynthesis protein MviN/MurJ (putative lipid II flippase)
LSPSISDLIVKIIYQRGKFTLSDAINVSHIQNIYFYSAPLTAIFMIYIRYLNAHEMHSYATKLAGTIVILNFIFCGVWLKMNRLDLIPYSIIGSYVLTLILFKFRKLK